ncbi:MAG TPA: hypothetical protein VMZ28_03160 [Kofleriaceae bacterium]|nr:hypothetical protein [Kofleriaceae bacterium]
MTRAAMAAALVALASTGARAEPPRPSPSPGGAVKSEERCAEVREGAQVTRPGLGAAGKAVRLGLVADARDASPATLGNLERLAGVFHKERVAAVIALGGLGATEDEIARVLQALKGAQVPLLALPGDREPEAAWTAALARVKKAGVDVVDLAKVRAISSEGIGIVSLPGRPGAHYAAGCRYRAADVEALKALDAGLVDAARPVVLVAHTPPRGHGPDAIDWAAGGANDGDLALAKLLGGLSARVGAFGCLPAAGGRAVDDGKPVAEGAWSERLYVGVGAVAGRGNGAILELADGKARWKTVKPPRPSPPPGGAMKGEGARP